MSEQIQLQDFLSLPCGTTADRVRRDVIATHLYDDKRLPCVAIFWLILAVKWVLQDQRARGETSTAIGELS